MPPIFIHIHLGILGVPQSVWKGQAQCVPRTAIELHPTVWLRRNLSWCQAHRDALEQGRRASRVVSGLWQRE